MDKYRRAYEYWRKLVSMTVEKEGCSWADAAHSWWQYLHGIIEVSIYDLYLAPEEFAEIQSWSVHMEEQDA